MTFEEIFNEDGLYHGNDFADGFCFEVIDGFLSALQYKHEKDLFPEKYYQGVYKGLFKKDYTKVFTVKSLFKNKQKDK